MSRSIAERIAACVLSVGIGLVGWVGWVESGSVVRNSYEMFRSAQRLGLDVLTPLRVAWFLVPVVSVLVVVLVSAGFVKSGFLALVAQALLVGGAGIAVLVVGVRGGVGSLVAIGLAGSAISLVGTSIIRSGLSSRERGDASMSSG